MRPNLFSCTKSIVKILNLAAYSVRKDIITYYLGRSVFRCHDDDDDDDDDDVCNIYNDTLSYSVAFVRECIAAGRYEAPL